MNQNISDDRFVYDGALPNTSGAWADLDASVGGTKHPFLVGDYTGLFLSALGAAAFEARTVQGRILAGEVTPRWFIIDDDQKITVAASLTTPNDGQVIPVGHPIFKIQIKTSATVSRAVIVATGAPRGA